MNNVHVPKKQYTRVALIHLIFCNNYCSLLSGLYRIGLGRYITGGTPPKGLSQSRISCIKGIPVKSHLLNVCPVRFR